jgi:hypothetical protein
MSLHGAIETLRGKVPPVPTPRNHGELVEATESKTVPSVPLVPLEKLKDASESRQDPDKTGNPNSDIPAFPVQRELGNPKPTPPKPIRRAVVRFKLIGNQGGGSLLGDFGDTPAVLVDDLRRRYGNRLAAVECEL